MVESLFTEVDVALNSGKHQLVLSLLQQLSNDNPDNPQVLFRYALSEEKFGDLRRAAQLYWKLIKMFPHLPVPYLFAGYLFELLQKGDLAASLYSLADDLDGRVLKLKLDDSGVNKDMVLRSSSGKQFLSRYFREQHQNTTIDSPKSIIDACWVQLWDKSIPFQNSLQRPHFFYMPHLVPKPVYDLSTEQWSRELCQGSKGIVDELTVYLQQYRGDVEPYLNQNYASQPTFKGLAGSTNWGAIHLYQEGKLNTATSTFFTKTLKYLESAPLYGLDASPFEVFFSLLKAGQSIPPHYGLSNHSLTVHLPLVNTEDAYLEVAKQRYYWREGELLAFDDSFIHAAINHGKQERIVLIFSIWNPSLDHLERGAIQQLFSLRKAWLEQRSQRIETALNHYETGEVI